MKIVSRTVFLSIMILLCTGGIFVYLVVVPVHQRTLRSAASNGPPESGDEYLARAADLLSQACAAQAGSTASFAEFEERLYQHANEAVRRQLEAQLQEKKVEATIVVGKDRNHGSIMMRMSAEDDPATQAVLEFIAKHSNLKLTPKAAK